MAHSLPRRRFMQGSALALVLGAAAACSSDSDSTSTTSSSDVTEDSFTGTGPITWVQGKDNSGGKVQERLDEWNALYPDEEVTLIELSASADEQRQSLINNAETQSSAYGVVSLDNVWVAEFAANQWVEELPIDTFQDDDIVEAVWNTGIYMDKLYAMPFGTDAPIMFYRKDLLEEAGVEVPTTWEEVQSCIEAVRQLDGHENIGGFGGQWNKYEGLTCNISEFIHTAGGAFVDDQMNVVVNSAESVQGLQNVIDGLDDGTIPKEALEWMEEDGRSAFESDEVLFYRQWPYQYANDAEVLGLDKFDIAPLPSMGGNDFVPTLGGHNCAISKYCENKATALKFIQWYTNKESQEFALVNEAVAPTLGSLYTDEALLEQFPYLTVLKESLDNAKGRPRVVNYGDVTAAIQDATYAALKGEMSAEDAIAQMDTDLKSVMG